MRVRAPNEARRPVAPGIRLLDHCGRWLFPHPEVLLGHQSAFAGLGGSHLLAGPESRHQIAFMEGAGPGGSTPPPPLSDYSKGSILKLLVDAGYEHAEARLDTVYPLFSELSVPHIVRNFQVMVTLISWKCSLETVLATLILETVAPPNRTPPELRPVLNNIRQLDTLDFTATSTDQVDNFRALLFQLANSHERLLLLAAKDKVDLELATKTFGEQIPPVLGMLAVRSYYATSWVLKALGLEMAGEELEDLGFLALSPDEYNRAEEYHRTVYGSDSFKGLELFKEVKTALLAHLDWHFLRLGPDGHFTSEKIPFDFLSRRKSRHQTIGKLHRTGRAQDIYGMRLVLPSNRSGDCYVMLNEVRRFFDLEGVWEDLPQEYDDYIANPKPNGYQSIHVCFQRVDGFMLDIQIRTAEMDNNAKYGKAAWLGYKGEADRVSQVEITPGLSVAEQHFASRKRAIADRGEYYVYDTTGLLHKLVTGFPRVAPTILDLACRVGQKEGMSVIGATVAENGKTRHLRISDELATGQRVSLEFGSSPQTHGRLRFAHTPRARSVILAALTGDSASRSAISEADLSATGRRLFEDLLAHHKNDLLKRYRPAFTLPDPVIRFSLERTVRRLAFTDENEFYMYLARLNKPHEYFQETVFPCIRQNFLATASRRRAGTVDFEVYAQDLPGVYFKLIEMMAKHGLDILTVEEVVKPGQPSTSLFRLLVPAGSDFNNFLHDIENLYRGLLPSDQTYSADIPLRVRIATSLFGNIGGKLIIFGPKATVMELALIKAGLVDSQDNILPPFYQIAGGTGTLQLESPGLNPDQLAQVRTITDEEKRLLVTIMVEVLTDRQFVLLSIFEKLFNLGVDISTAKLPEVAPGSDSLFFDLTVRLPVKQEAGLWRSLGLQSKKGSTQQERQKHLLASVLERIPGVRTVT